MKRFKDKVVLITGGTKGIGLVTAKQFVNEGATVIINYHSNDEVADKAITELKELGESVDVKKFDVSDRTSVEESIDEIFDEYGEISILVNNAAILDNALTVQMDDGQWSDVIETNLFGSFYCARKTGREMMLNGINGSIINVSSIAGIYGFAGQSNYGSSKAAINNLTHIMSMELASRNIRVNAVAPGLVDTQTSRDSINKSIEETLKSIPKGRPADPEEIANVILFVASEEASYMDGSIVQVDGGLSPYV